MNQCILCSPGFYQPNEAASQCIECDAGYYLPDFGKASCISCASGGYCNNNNSSINGAHIPCSAGTYNGFQGQSGNQKLIVGNGHHSPPSNFELKRYICKTI